MKPIRDEKTETIIQLTKQHLPEILLGFVLAVIILLNWQGGAFVIGLDTYAPYFGTKFILERVFSPELLNFVTLNPLLLISPLFDTLSAMGIPEWAVNQIFLFTSLIVGVLGMATLTQFATGKRKGASSISFTLGGLLYLATLFTAWIFNQPNFLFVSAYAAMPWITYLACLVIQKKNIFTHPLAIIFYLYIAILYLQTSLNLVAFGCYTLSAVFIAWAISSQQKTIFSIQRMLLLPLVVFTIWTVLLQIELLLAGRTEFVGSIVANHIETIAENPLTDGTTRDLRASSILRSSFPNIILFSGGWMETHDPSRTPLFQEYDRYTNNLVFEAMGFFPFVLALVTLFLGHQKTNSIVLHIPLAVGIFLSSGIFITIIGNSSALETAFRWSASKFWMLTVIPICVLATEGTVMLLKRTKASLARTVVLLSVVGSLTFFILPVMNGQLISPQLIVSIPEQYDTMNDFLSHSAPNGKILYLPTTDNAYFYSYTWGYFGAEFLSYMTQGDGETEGIIPYFNNIILYKKTAEALASCDPRSFLSSMQKERITTIIVDYSIISDQTPADCLDKIPDLAKSAISKDISIYTFQQK